MPTVSPRSAVVFGILLLSTASLLAQTTSSDLRRSCVSRIRVDLLGIQNPPGIDAVNRDLENNGYPTFDGGVPGFGSGGFVPVVVNGIELSSGSDMMPWGIHLSVSSLHSPFNTHDSAGTSLNATVTAGSGLVFTGYQLFHTGGFSLSGMAASGIEWANLVLSRSHLESLPVGSNTGFDNPDGEVVVQKASIAKRSVPLRLGLRMEYSFLLHRSVDDALHLYLSAQPGYSLSLYQSSWSEGVIGLADVGFSRFTFQVGIGLSLQQGVDSAVQSASKGSR